MLQPDIVLLDVRLQGGEDGISLIKPLRDICPKCHVLAFTAFDSPTAVARAAAAGATDFILKTIGKDALCDAIEYAAVNATSRPDSKLRKLKAHLSKRPLPPDLSLIHI